MLKAQNTKNPMVEPDFGTFSRMMMMNPTQAEQYRKQVTKEWEMQPAISSTWEWDNWKKEETLPKENKEIKRDNVEKTPEIINLDEVRKALKEKWVKGVHLYKDEQKLITKAREHNIL